MSWQAVEAVIKHSRSSGAARMLLTVIAYHADKDGGNSYPSLNDLMAEAALSERSVWYALKSLVALGELVLSGASHLADKEHPYSLAFMWCEVIAPAAVPQEAIEEKESAKFAPAVVVESANFAPDEDSGVQNLQQESAKFAPALIGIKSPLTVHGLETYPPTQDAKQRERGGGGRGGLEQTKTGAWLWLHTGACAVLGRETLTKAQHEQVVDFFDRYSGDPRLTEELVLYATRICTSIGKHDTRYWYGILRKRLEDPAWVDVETELRSGVGKEIANGRHNGNGHGEGDGARPRPNGVGAGGKPTANTRPLNNREQRTRDTFKWAFGADMDEVLGNGARGANGDNSPRPLLGGPTAT